MVNVVSHHNVVNNSHVPELWLIFTLSLNTWHNQDTNMTSLWEPCNPDRAPLKEVLGGQYNYREGGRQVLRQGAKGRRRNRKWQCSKDPCAQKVSGGRTDPSPKYRWKVHG